MTIDPILEALTRDADQMAAQGWCVIRTGARTREEGLSLLGALVPACGPVIPHTENGAFADVTTADHLNDRSTLRPQSDNGPLFPHTDGVLSPQLPGVFAMLCIESAGTGGASVLVDVRPFLREHRGSGDLDPLFDDDAVAIVRGPVQTSVSVLRRRGPFVDVAFSSHEYNTTAPKPACAEAFAALHRFVGDPANHRRVQLTSGDLILVANRFCLHGRDAFEDGGRRRHLVRGWYTGPVQGCAAFDGFVPADTRFRGGRCRSS
ncbi:MAG TPA: TauD/TfdA family dioxygenase [Longimicrobium sp.]|nr:TauD/TfdA family dioxygenase [Longimicrobium sp.]